MTRTIPNDFPATRLLPNPSSFCADMHHHIGDPLHAMYGEHALRAKQEGFAQMPYGEFMKLHIVLYWGIEQ